MVCGRFFSASISLLNRASLDYAKLAQSSEKNGKLPKIFLTGDLLTRGSDFASAGLFHHLAKNGIQIILDPTASFLEFVVRKQPQLLFDNLSTEARLPRSPS